MPLILDSKRLDVTMSPAEILQMHPQLQDRAKALTSQQTKTFGPKGFLYVQQREFAVTTPSDRFISIMGSEDATTCHILVLRHTGSGATCLAHCDGSDTEIEVASILHSVKTLTKSSSEGRFELHIVGGFIDQRQLSQKLSSELLKAFDNLPDEVHLLTFCVSEINDKEENGVHFPIIYGIAVNVKTAQIFKATFQDRGPCEDLRSAYSLTGGAMVNIYDFHTGELSFGPYCWTPFAIPNIDFWLKQEDDLILQYFSTSPQAEPPHFVAHMRSALEFLKAHPYPMKFLFPDDKPLFYKKNVDGLWEKI